MCTPVAPTAAVHAPLLSPQTPHFDMDLRLCDSPDIMALPGVPLLVQSGAALLPSCTCAAAVGRSCRCPALGHSASA